MLTDKEYLQLIDIANESLRYQKSKLVFRRFSDKKDCIQNVYMDISGVDIVHDLIIKFHESGDEYTFDILKDKIYGRIKTVYWESVKANDPDYVEYNRQVQKIRYRENVQDPEFVKKQSENSRKWQSKKLLDNPNYFIDKRVVYRNNIINLICKRPEYKDEIIKKYINLLTLKLIRQNSCKDPYFSLQILEFKRAKTLILYKGDENKNISYYSVKYCNPNYLKNIYLKRWQFEKIKMSNDPEYRDRINAVRHVTYLRFKQNIGLSDKYRKKYAELWYTRIKLLNPNYFKDLYKRRYEALQNISEEEIFLIKQKKLIGKKNTLNYYKTQEELRRRVENKLIKINPEYKDIFIKRKDLVKQKNEAEKLLKKQQKKEALYLVKQKIEAEKLAEKLFKKQQKQEALDLVKQKKEAENLAKKLLKQQQKQKALQLIKQKNEAEKLLKKQRIEAEKLLKKQRIEAAPFGMRQKEAKFIRFWGNKDKRPYRQREKERMAIDPIYREKRIKEKRASNLKSKSRPEFIEREKIRLKNRYLIPEIREKQKQDCKKRYYKLKETNPEKLKEEWIKRGQREKERMKVDPEYCKKKKTVRKTSYEKRKPKLLVQFKEYYDNNKEQKLARQREYQKEKRRQNPELVRAQDRIKAQRKREKKMQQNNLIK